MFFSPKEKFITGNEACVEGALSAGAKMMCGYPITPATEILENWSKLSSEKASKVITIQAEDEISAGFNLIGGLLSGVKCFTATAGVGHILMQDSISMCEAMRLPFVGIIMQRGGPSTGTVIYGQQEVTLACYGGNGEGLRIVYSTNSPQELYDYTIKAFNCAWKYKFPTFVLGDGYQSKMKTKVKLNNIETVKSNKIIGENGKFVNIRNCYNFENQLAEVLANNISEYDKISKDIIEFQEYECKDADTIVFAHGIVSSSAKEAINILRNKYHKKVGLFRPITLRPFPKNAASRAASSVNNILIVESSNGHFSRIIKENLYGLTRINVLLRPVMGINPEEIVESVLNLEKNKDNFWIEH